MAGVRETHGYSRFCYGIAQSTARCLLHRECTCRRMTNSNNHRTPRFLQRSLPSRSRPAHKLLFCWGIRMGCGSMEAITPSIG